MVFTAQSGRESQVGYPKFRFFFFYFFFLTQALAFAIPSLSCFF